jgi:hypothetical protein
MPKIRRENLPRPLHRHLMDRVWQRQISTVPVSLLTIETSLEFVSIVRTDTNGARVFSAPMGCASFLMAFSRAEGAEGAEVEMERRDATYCQTLTFSCVKKGILSILCTLHASARACLFLFWAQGQGNRMSTPKGSNPARSSPIGQNCCLTSLNQWQYQCSMHTSVACWMRVLFLLRPRDRFRNPRTRSCVTFCSSHTYLTNLTALC